MSEQDRVVIENTKTYITENLPAMQEYLKYHFTVARENDVIVVTVFNKTVPTAGGGAVFYLDKKTLKVVDFKGFQ